MIYKDISGYCDFHDFYKWVFDQLPDGANIVEVGVYLGHSVAYMATLAKESGKDIKIFAVDTFEGSEEHKRKGVKNFLDEYIDNIFKCEVHKYIHTFMDFDSVSAATHEKLQNIEFDFVFIDAAHDYDSVKSDIEAWLPKVKPGGILAGHDYCDSWPGVMKAVDELIPDRILTSKSVWYKKLEQTY